LGGGKGREKERARALEEGGCHASGVEYEVYGRYHRVVVCSLVASFQSDVVRLNFLSLLPQLFIQLII
jgi:hypothetical protein